LNEVDSARFARLFIYRDKGSRMTHPSRRSLYAAPIALGIAGLLALSLSAPAVASTPPDVKVHDSDITTDASSVGGTTGGWLIDDYSPTGGKVDIATPEFTAEPSLRLQLPLKANKAILQYRYPSADFPVSDSTDDFAAFKSLLSGANYTFSGSHVNYQVSIFYKPSDLGTYGPSGGATKCSAATSSPPSSTSPTRTRPSSPT
jgi:hypothetical protein